ncbi:endonuclease/exonuclease/phosphatase family protein [Roseiflexus sp.]|uniref:endonuclease/exonuclease/phosphatase family protein n=1 Tax=Roseiflexus sp. TaxID=2562120 RepID=UPI00398A8348
MQSVQPQYRQNHRCLVNLLFLPAIAYLLFIAVWLAMRMVYEDRWWWLFVLNAGTLYLLLPLPFVLLAALIARQPFVIAFSVLLLVPGAPLLAAPWMPSITPGFIARSEFTVMTFNINGGNDRPDRVIAAIRQARPDIVAMQELNPDIAAALERDLKNDYPYQALDPQWGVTGMGVISRFPLRRADAQLPGDSWIGDPQVVEIDVPGGMVTLLNVHAIPPFGPRDWMTWSVGERERQAEAIASFARDHRKPLIVAGDMNATPFHRAYRILGREVIDVWRKKGGGAGFTWPSGEQRLMGIPIPAWLVRIDYVFISNDLTCTDASVGPWDGVSDHRAVVATLFVGKTGE